MNELIKDSVAVVVMLVALLNAQEAFAAKVYSTVPGTNIRNYSAPTLITDGKTAYQTVPGTNIRNYKAPSYINKDGTFIPTIRGTDIPDYSAPVTIAIPVPVIKEP